MNWKEISEKCPKAISKLKDWATLKDETSFESLRIYFSVLWPGALRSLYNFFDEQGIFGWVSPEIQYTRELDEDNRNPHYVIDEWGYDIHDNSYELAIGYPFESRKKAEEAMFESEFKILEEKLKQKT